MSNFHYWKHHIMFFLTLKIIAYDLKDPYPILLENLMTYQLEDLKKLISTFNDDDLIVKTNMIAYIENNLAKVFKNYKTGREVFEAVSSKYDTKTTTYIHVLVQ